MIAHADWSALDASAWSTIVGAAVLGWLPILWALWRLGRTPWVCRILIGAYLVASGLGGDLFLFSDIALQQHYAQPPSTFPQMVMTTLIGAVFWPLAVGWGLLGMA
jgi:hypothetical protein